MGTAHNSYHGCWVFVFSLAAPHSSVFLRHHRSVAWRWSEMHKLNHLSLVIDLILQTILMKLGAHWIGEFALSFSSCFRTLLACHRSLLAILPFCIVPVFIFYDILLLFLLHLICLTPPPNDWRPSSISQPFLVIPQWCYIRKTICKWSWQFYFELVHQLVNIFL